LNKFVQVISDHTICEHCASEILNGGMEKHLRTVCPKFLIRCTLGCGEEMYRSAVPYHTTICRKRTIHCEKCSASMWAEEV
jgi:hypothetical protein